MTHQQFIDLVCRMRSAQKQYFRTRTFADLEESKKLEREVDKALQEYNEPSFYFSLFPRTSSS